MSISTCAAFSLVVPSTATSTLSVMSSIFLMPEVLRTSSFEPVRKVVLRKLIWRERPSVWVGIHSQSSALASARHEPGDNQDRAEESTKRDRLVRGRWRV